MKFKNLICLGISCIGLLVSSASVLATEKKSGNDNYFYKTDETTICFDKETAENIEKNLIDVEDNVLKIEITNMENKSTYTIAKPKFKSNYWNNTLGGYYIVLPQINKIRKKKQEANKINNDKFFNISLDKNFEFNSNNTYNLKIFDNNEKLKFEDYLYLKNYKNYDNKFVFVKKNENENSYENISDNGSTDIESLIKSIDSKIKNSEDYEYELNILKDAMKIDNTEINVFTCIIVTDITKRLCDKNKISNLTQGVILSCMPTKIFQYI